MKTVLITAIGSMSSKAAIDSLKKKGFRVIGTNYYPKEYIAEAYMVDQFYNVPRYNCEVEYIKTLCSIIAKEEVDYVIPLTDPEVDVINEYREKVERTGTIICISNYETINVCRDKLDIATMLSENIAEIRTIPTINFDDISELSKYPLVCKKRNGRSSEDLHIIHDYDEWIFIKDRIALDNYIVQRFIQGNVVCVDVIRNINTKQVIAIPRKELLRTSNGAGLSVFVFKDEKLQNLCFKISECLDINGCVNFEFILDENGEYWFMECNPRLSGGIAFSCIVGYDYIINHIRCFTAEDILDELSEFDNKYIVKQYTEIVTKVEK